MTPVRSRFRFGWWRDEAWVGAVGDGVGGAGSGSFGGVRVVGGAQRPGWFGVGSGGGGGRGGGLSVLRRRRGRRGPAAREAVVADVLSARPGLDFLCIGGARPRDLTDGEDGFVDEAWMEAFEPEVVGAARGVGAIGVRFECETDGAVAPLFGLLPTVSYLGQASEVVAIPPRPRLSVHGAEALEGDTGANGLVFLIELTAPSIQDVTVNYRTLYESSPPDGTESATAGSDYVLVVDSVVIQAGETSKAVVVQTVAEDQVYELDEVFLLELELVPSDPDADDVPSLANPLSSDPDDDDYWKAVATGTIKNDEPKPELSFEGDPSASEAAGQITFVVTLDRPTSQCQWASTTPLSNGTAEGPVTTTNTLCLQPSTRQSAPMSSTTADTGNPCDAARRRHSRGFRDLRAPHHRHRNRTRHPGPSPEPARRHRDLRHRHHRRRRADRFDRRPCRPGQRGQHPQTSTSPSAPCPQPAKTP